MRSRVVLPSPLRPTTPITSPRERPRLTESSSVRVPNVIRMRSALTRLTIGFPVFHEVRVSPVRRTGDADGMRDCNQQIIGVSRNNDGTVETMGFGRNPALVHPI